jgi:CelD/BcsL family acetyltransferase involved in cellulose biosynthesis
VLKKFFKITAVEGASATDPKKFVTTETMQRSHSALRSRPLSDREIDAAEEPRATRSAIVELADVPREAWLRLCEIAIDPNPFYDPDWCLAAAQGARVYAGARALLVWQGERLIGLLPVVSAWQTIRLPLPVLYAWQAYGPLTMPLIDPQSAPDAWRGLRAAAAMAGARALRFRYFNTASEMLTLLDPMGEAAARAFTNLQRARLDATQDADQVFNAGLSASKQKRLRRQRRHLEEGGPLAFRVAREQAEVALALEEFLQLETRGWKGESGSAMARDAGDAAFIRSAGLGMSARGRLEVATLRRDEQVLASTIMLRQGRLASWFKIAIDWDEAKSSPGMQLALELTRHYCADPTIDGIDSNTDADHSIADDVWPDRMTLCDFMVPVRAADPLIPTLRHVLSVREIARNQARTIVRRLRGAKA